ncbi:serine/threonine-protein kinase [Anatilimnocola floriformis]|uniref:serine/threonine-protein kinase n=1 Tax=Anatilimnocola floriformis TaxID=2948575 RepID=UPI0020C28897|nr:serine/threonine-protein kinase [Anatilimnocola floriformis]
MPTLDETDVQLKCPHGHRWQVSVAANTVAATEDTVAGGGHSTWCPVCGEPGAAAQIDLQQNEQPLPEIPGYELLEELGRGGMAVVYKARQLKPQRIVALKILHHPAIGDESWIARFRSEAEAVARLEHPHIVRMYEVGDAPRMSYLALEFIDGGTLAQRINGQPQNPRWTAETVATIARAMHFAHQLGIIHRDLKPGNILLQGASSQPRVTDFGLARRQDQDNQTRTGDILGTPAYMAPEQATGVTRNISPACDVHALGVILYEMLTGLPPYRGVDVMDTLRLVMTADATPPRQLRPEIPRDLETICLKCLEKSPRQRYASAAELADELERYLRGETIITRPTTPWEKSYKWSRRHPAAALAIGVAILIPLLIVAGLIWHNGQMSRELANTTEQRNRAEANLLGSQQAIDELLTELSTGHLANLPRSSPHRRQLLDWAYALCRQLQNENPNDTRLHLQSARAQRQMADIERLLGKFPAAAANYSDAIRKLTWISAHDASNALAHRELAAALNNAGLLAEQQGQTAAAERLFREVEEQWKDQAQRRAESADLTLSQAATQNNLGRLLMQLGQFDEADKAFQHALELYTKITSEKPDEPSLQLALNSCRVNFGNLLMARGDFAGAQKLFDHAQGQLVELLKTHHDNSELSAVLAVIENNRAAALSASEEIALAETAFARAQGLLAQLVRDFPADLAYREQLATSQLNLALLLSDNKREDEANSLIETARQTFELLAAEQPDSPDFRQGLTKALSQLAHEQAQADEQATAELTLRDALKMQQRLAEQFPERADVWSQLGLFQQSAAQLLAKRAANSDARRYWEQAIESQQRALKANEAAVAYRARLCDHLETFATWLIAQGEPSAAAPISVQLAALDPEDADQQLQAARFLAQCIPLAATVKGQDKINGQDPAAYCREHCLQLLQAAAAKDQKGVNELLESTPLRDEAEFQQLRK